MDDKPPCAEIMSQRVGISNSLPVSFQEKIKHCSSRLSELHIFFIENGKDKQISHASLVLSNQFKSKFVFIEPTCGDARWALRQHPLYSLVRHFFADFAHFLTEILPIL